MNPNFMILPKAHLFFNKNDEWMALVLNMSNNNIYKIDILVKYFVFHFLHPKCKQNDQNVQKYVIF